MVGNKLNLIDGIKATDGKKYPLRLRDDLNKWIDENTTGSKNSAVNFLVNVGINQVAKILEHDSLYEKVVDDA